MHKKISWPCLIFQLNDCSAITILVDRRIKWQDTLVPANLSFSYLFDEKAISHSCRKSWQYHVKGLRLPPFPFCLTFLLWLSFDISSSRLINVKEKVPYNYFILLLLLLTFLRAPAPTPTTCARLKVRKSHNWLCFSVSLSSFFFISFFFFSTLPGARYLKALGMECVR